MTKWISNLLPLSPSDFKTFVGISSCPIASLVFVEPIAFSNSFLAIGGPLLYVILYSVGRSLWNSSSTYRVHLCSICWIPNKRSPFLILPKCCYFFDHIKWIIFPYLLFRYVLGRIVVTFCAFCEWNLCSVLFFFRLTKRQIPLLLS